MPRPPWPVDPFALGGQGLLYLGADVRPRGRVYYTWGRTSAPRYNKPCPPNAKGSTGGRGILQDALRS